MQLVCGLDYAAMKKAMQPLAEEIAQAVFNPVRLMRIADQYGIEFETLEQMY